MTQQPQQPRTIRLDIPANLSATFANAVIVNQTATEIVLDFAQVLPNDDRARVQQRIVMTPAAAKSFLRALTANLARFEQVNGEIKLPTPAPGSATLADQLFGGVRPEGEE